MYTNVYNIYISCRGWSSHEFLVHLSHLLSTLCEGAGVWPSQSVWSLSRHSTSSAEAKKMRSASGLIFSSARPKTPREVKNLDRMLNRIWCVYTPISNNSNTYITIYNYLYIYYISSISSIYKSLLPAIGDLIIGPNLGSTSLRRGRPRRAFGRGRRRGSAPLSPSASRAGRGHLSSLGWLGRSPERAPSLATWRPVAKPLKKAGVRRCPKDFPWVLHVF